MALTVNEFYKKTLTKEQLESSMKQVEKFVASLSDRNEGKVNNEYQKHKTVY
jgi:hypothetical protein